MISIKDQISARVMGNHVFLHVAVEYSGYNEQYLRRLLHSGKLPGVKVSRLWLVELHGLRKYVQKAKTFKIADGEESSLLEDISTYLYPPRIRLSLRGW
jgi:hypothetical protein